MAILGLENAGKSTLVQIIAGNTLPCTPIWFLTSPAEDR
ncbi:hypothetical protein BVRB_031390 [Beta vulgaris subsp. vulgaris]|uniref:Uncharacterized protein n=1 Tax=Beta vulgaris subsp. vulgaris TaxID=3555 RepID=A0A0J8B0L8_BETVV|nr:hypothetical protein BVRB_031390 [Beta vulgaris subsp. vulgaris]